MIAMRLTTVARLAMVIAGLCVIDSTSGAGAQGTGRRTGFKPHETYRKTLAQRETADGLTDELGADGVVYDSDRIMFLRNYLAMLQREPRDGS